MYRKYNKTVVVLIDEYDKPILDHISDIELAEANRKALRGFYGVLKSMDSFLRLTFITGITKFTKTSVFSGLNNLRDLTLSRKYANICWTCQTMKSDWPSICIYYALKWCDKRANAVPATFSSGRSRASLRFWLFPARLRSARRFCLPPPVPVWILSLSFFHPPPPAVRAAR